MKPLIKRFFQKGLPVAAGGPVILAVVYYFLGQYGVIENLSVGEVVRGILTVTVLAFMAGGIPVVYEVERLSRLAAALIHVLVLYADYILIYLMNGWLQYAKTPILVFTILFFVGFGIIWLFIYKGIQANVERMNRELDSAK